MAQSLFQTLFGFKTVLENFFPSSIEWVAELGADRPDLGGRKPRGEGLAKKRKRVTGLGKFGLEPPDETPERQLVLYDELNAKMGRRMQGRMELAKRAVESRKAPVGPAPATGPVVIVLTAGESVGQRRVVYQNGI